MTQKIVFVILFLVSIGATAQTQQTPKRYGRPDIPGTFVVELGVNRGLSAPNDFSLGLWGSRTVNIYYQYDFRILKSRFSVVPGIGLSLERFKFKNLKNLGYNENDSLKFLSPTQMGLTGVKKSQLITNYIDIPVEIRYSSNPDDPGRSFKMSIGGRIGYMYDNFAKIKYKEDGEVKKFKDKQDFNLNRLRYGVFAKIGAGNFSVFGYYNLTPLFKSGEGPGAKGELLPEFNTFTVGISLASF